MKIIERVSFSIKYCKVPLFIYSESRSLSDARPFSLTVGQTYLPFHTPFQVLPSSPDLICVRFVIALVFFCEENYAQCDSFARAICSQLGNERLKKNDLLLSITWNLVGVCFVMMVGIVVTKQFYFIFW